MLVLVIISVAADSRVPRGVAAVAIGAALAAAIVISGPVSGAGVNPARAIGPMILVGRLAGWWAYLAAPVIAGILASRRPVPAARPNTELTARRRPAIGSGCTRALEIAAALLPV